MAIPASGPLVMGKIYQELDGAGYSAASDSGEIVTLAGLVGGQPDTINSASASKPNTSTPHSMSEWYSYDHSASSFSWPTPSLGFAYANAANYTSTKTNSSGNSAHAGSQIQLTFNANGNHFHKVKDYTSTSAGSYTTGGSFSSSGTPTILEARWIIVDGDFTMDGGSGDKIQVGYVPGGSISSQYVDVRTGSNGNATDLDYTGSYVTITPAVFGGSGSNIQEFSIQATAQSTNYPGDQAKIATNASGDYVGLEIRANQDNNQTIIFRSGISTNVNINAESYETPGFTCIMPDMMVNKRYINEDNIADSIETRIGDIQVGDYILAQGDLNDPSVESQWAEVTEARTHTREGYWNVEGLHITNDHPIWLTNESGSAWVKVEDINNPGSITRNYVAGTVDPVYLGTTPGHYYVYANNKKITVSGDYAPTTE